jgi:hypothetical protein
MPIREIIDLDIVNFIEYVTGLDFSQCNNLKCALEAELMQVRASKIMDWNAFKSNAKLFFALANPESCDKSVEDLCAQCVIEQRIMDKINVTERFKKIKGVDLSIFAPKK